MSKRYTTTKQAVTAEDLKELVDCYFRVRRLHAGLHHASPQQAPLMAASATLKACWAELSGAGSAWGFSAELVPLDGLAPGATRSEGTREGSDMRWRGPERNDF